MLQNLIVYYTDQLWQEVLCDEQKHVTPSTSQLIPHRKMFLSPNRTIIVGPNPLTNILMLTISGK